MKCSYLLAAVQKSVLVLYKESWWQRWLLVLCCVLCERCHCPLGSSGTVSELRGTKGHQGEAEGHQQGTKGHQRGIKGHQGGLKAIREAKGH